jgi:hypothetical protein
MSRPFLFLALMIALLMLCLAVLSGLIAVPAAAQGMVCAPGRALQEGLEINKYKEKRMFSAVIGPGGTVEFYLNAKTQTWTWFVVGPIQSCIISGGKGVTFDKPEPSGEKS